MDSSPGADFCTTSSGDFATWQTTLDAPVGSDLEWVGDLTTQYDFATLVPDYSSAYVSGGRGSITNDTWATVAVSTDETLLIAYTPDQRELDVEMSQLAGYSTASWFNPRTGATTLIGTDLVNSGTQSWTPPSASDWVLVVEVWDDCARQ